MGTASDALVCEALYHGYRAVEGAQTPATIGELVEAVVTEKYQNSSGSSLSKVWSRVQLQLDDERLRLVPVRKDEGFESDSEGSSGSVCDEPCCINTETKTIRDHMLRLDKLLRQDDFPAAGHNNRAAAESSNSSSSSSSSSSVTATDISPTDSNSITSEDSALSSSKKSREDNSLSSGAESDGESSPRLQRADSAGTALTCHSRAAVSVPNEHHSSPVNNSSDGINHGVDTFLMSDIIFCHICSLRPKIVVVVVKVAAGTSLLRAHVLECLTQQAAKTLYSHYYKAINQYKLNRYRNSKRRCEFKRELAAYSIDADQQFNLNDDKNVPERCTSSQKSSAARKDSGNSSICETDDRLRGSLRSLKSRELFDDDKNINVIQVKTSEGTDESTGFSLVQHTDSNGITHIEIESGPVSLINGGQVTSEDYSSIISLSTPETNGLVTAFGGLKSNNINADEGNSCPNSLITEHDSTFSYDKDKEKRFRQRQPALLLRDEMEIFDYKHSRKSHDEPRELRSRRERYLAAECSKPRDTCRPPLPPITWTPPERPSRSRDPSRPSRDTKELEFKSKHNKGPAPLPPPRRHPNDSNLLLVPTKSGHEPKKSYYPKESHIVRGNKIVRVDFPSVPVWNHRSDPNNNARHYIHYTGGWSHEYHAPRIREPSMRSDVRRRSRSKSPARKPIANRYLDAVTTFNFSQKLKELSDAVFSSKRTGGNNSSSFIGGNLVNSLPSIGGRSRPGHQRMGSTSSVPVDVESLKPVIKKGRTKSGDCENRRVTFSAYATVQLMES